jgi:hypothetical protein
MLTLREKLEEELKMGQPGSEWYKLFQPIVKIVAGHWPPRYFIEFEPDASNERTWQYSEKKDLTQKLFHEQILIAARRKTDFVLSAHSDVQIRKNAKIVVSQFLVDISKGSDDKRAFGLIESRLKARGVTLGGITGAAGIPTVLSNQRLSEKVQRILFLCPERLPNAFLPAGEGERESPNWTPKGYDWIADQLIELDEPLTEIALRDGIAEALTHLRLSMYYLDEPGRNHGSEMTSWEEEQANEGEDLVLGGYLAASPEELAISRSREEIASQILKRLSEDTIRFLSHATISKDMTKLANSLSVSRQRIYDFKAKSVNEVELLMNEMKVEQEEVVFVRRSLISLIDPPATFELGEVT